MTDKKNGNEEDFDDEDLDLEELEDDEISDEDSIEEEYEDNLEDDSWDEAADADAQNKKSATLIKTPGEKKGLLSTNNMIIAGAVIVGGIIMISTISSETAQKATETSTFKSIMNISGIMDRTLYGDSEQQVSAIGEAGKETPAVSEDGFLNNSEEAPGSVTPETEAAPTVPVETAGMQDADDAIAFNNTPPRGPDDNISVPGINDASGMSQETQTPVSPLDAAQVKDVVQVDIPEEDTETAGSAEALLKQGMENRVATTQPSVEMPVTDAVDAAAPIAGSIEQPIVPVSPPPSNQMDSQAITHLEKKMEGIMDRLNKVESALKDIDDGHKGEEYARLVQDVEQLRGQLQAPAKVTTPSVTPAVKKPVVKKGSSSDAAYVPQQKKPVAAPAAKPAAKWVLRAAQPGRAWVSRSGERDMQSVEVGQSLPGIGRISAITFDAGAWKITGTQGVIAQE